MARFARRAIRAVAKGVAYVVVGAVAFFLAAVVFTEVFHAGDVLIRKAP